MKFWINLALSHQFSTTGTSTLNENTAKTDVSFTRSILNYSVVKIFSPLLQHCHNFGFFLNQELLPGFIVMPFSNVKVLRNFRLAMQEELNNWIKFSCLKAFVKMHLSYLKTYLQIVIVVSLPLDKFILDVVIVKLCILQIHFNFYVYLNPNWTPTDTEVLLGSLVSFSRNTFIIFYC